jgi:hypothetical protein
LCAFILFMLARNVVICTFMFIAPSCMLAAQCPWFRSVGSVSYCLAFYKAFCWLVVEGPL